MCMYPVTRGTVYSCIAVTVSARDGYWAGIAGWVYRLGNTGPTLRPRAREQTQIPAERAPEVPCRDWSGWVSEAGTVPFACHPRYVRTHPASRARSVPLQGPSLVLLEQNGDISVIPQQS